MALIYDFLSEDDGLINKTVNGFLPSMAIIPLKYDNQENAEIIVREGETVKEGQVLSRINGYCIHSSIPGTVTEIFETDFADGKHGTAAKIKFFGSLAFSGKKLTKINPNSFDSSSLLFLFNEKGVLNTFEKPCSLTNQIKNLDSKSNLFLVVRLYSDDPSRITEGFLTDNYFEQIKEGAFIIAKAMKSKGIIFAYDSNKSMPDFSFRDLTIPVEKVGLDAKSYPNGFKHEIAKAVKEQLKFNETSKKFLKIGNKELYVDCITALNAYNAVVLNEPSINVNVHVTGDCLNAAGVLKVKAGITLRELTKQTGGFKRKLGKIVINGIVTGNSLMNLDIPISKDVKSVAFIPADKKCDQKMQTCIRCGNCNKICPIGLYPQSLYRYSLNKEKDEYQYTLIKQTSLLCTECSLCNSVCPSRIPLSQTIGKIKEELKNE